MKQPIQVSIDDLRSNLSEIIGRVMYANEQVFIKKYNREAVVILSKQEYEALVDPTKRLSKSEWQAKFNVFENIQKKIGDVSPAVIQKTITKAVTEVRAAKKT